MKMLILIVCFLLPGAQLSANAQVIPCPTLECPLYGINQEGLTVTDALAQLGLHLQQGFVLFGAELKFDQPSEPLVSLHVSEAASLRSGLQEVLNQLPGYEWEQVSEHVIDVYPVGAKKAVDDILNLPVSNLELNGSADDIILNPAQYLPELYTELAQATVQGKCRASSPGIRSEGPHLHLHIASSTVREVLNSLMQAELGVTNAEARHYSGWLPVGWVYKLRIAPGVPPVQTHTWEANWSVRDWTSQPGH